MPIRVILHERNSFAFGRFSDDDGRFSYFFSRTIDRHELGNIVSVYFLHIPIKGLPFIHDRLKSADVVDQVVRLAPVAVQEHTQIGQFVVSGEHGGFPDLTFLAFPVADQREHPPPSGIVPDAQSHSGDDADIPAPVTLWTVRCRERGAYDVLLKPCPRLIKGEHHFSRKESPVGEHRPRRSVTHLTKRRGLFPSTEDYRDRFHDLKVKTNQDLDRG